MEGDKSNNDSRLMTRKQAAAYCGMSTPTFDKWVRAGVFPEPVSITNRWDRKAIDAALDKRSGLDKPESKESALDKWKREQDEKAAARLPLKSSTGEDWRKW